jgi:myosin XVIII
VQNLNTISPPSIAWREQWLADHSSNAFFSFSSLQVLFRSGVLNQLEAKRDELLSDRIIQLQAFCRGYLARRRVGQRRVQVSKRSIDGRATCRRECLINTFHLSTPKELAVRCIQRNVRAFMQVRDWPWWRLLVRVTPLLNVHRTEEQLKIANDELQAFKAKMEKLETDRNALKTENSKLESKVSCALTKANSFFCRLIACMPRESSLFLLHPFAVF